MDSIPLERIMAGMPSLDRNLWNGVASFGRGRRVTRVLFTGTEEFFKPGYRAQLTQAWIPALSGIDDKLRRGTMAYMSPAFIFIR